MPLLRFHLRVGVQLAVRAAAPLAGLPILILLLQQDPGGATRSLIAWLFNPANPASGLALAAAALALAWWAAPRVTAGFSGWVRHLPAGDVERRRAALVALVAAQSPLFIALLLLAVPAAHRSLGVAVARLAALLLAMCAAAVVSWPGTRPWRSRPLAFLAICLAAPANTPGMLAALPVVVAAELLAGPLVSRGRLHRRLSLPLPTPMLVGIRALGNALAIAPLPALVPLAAMVALRVNNDLPPAIRAGAARLGGGLAVAVLVSALVERLAIRRPAWAWARSLPAGARRRVGEDALLLGAPCLVPLAITAALDLTSALAITICVPAVALRGAAAARRSLESKNGPAVRLLAEAALLACWVALLPWLAAVTLVAAPFAWRAAAEQDRRQKVSRWEERHHSAAGDPMSWSGA